MLDYAFLPPPKGAYIESAEPRNNFWLEVLLGLVVVHMFLFP